MSWKMMSAPLNTSTVQTNVPELTEKFTQFKTPRPASHKSKVIRKEKLRTLQNSQPSIKPGGGTPSRSDGLPTAYVPPSKPAIPLTPPETSHPRSPRTMALEKGSLSRTRSIEFVLDKDGNAHMTDPSSNGMPEVGRRWNSYQNMNEIASQFHEVPRDLNETVDPSCLATPFRDRHSYAGSSIDHRQNYVEQYNKQLRHSTGNVDSITEEFSSHGKKDIFMSPKPTAMPFAHHAKTYVASSAQPLAYLATPSFTNSSMGLSSHSHPVTQLSKTALSSCPPEVSHLSSIAGSADFTTGLISWKEDHEQKLQHQKRAVDASCTNNAGSTISLPSTFLDPHRLDAIKQVADQIIKEKDGVIERQRQQLLQLERELKAMDGHLTKASLGWTERDAMSLKVEELQYENDALKAKLTETVSHKSIDCETLEKKLGAAEYELMQIKLGSDTEVSLKSREIHRLKDQISEKEKELEHWKEQCEQLKESSDSLQRKFGHLERYLDDLPTADEHNKNNTELRNLKEAKTKYKLRCTVLEEKLAFLQKTIKSQEGKISNLSETENHMTERMRKLETENMRLRRHLNGEEDPQEFNIEHLRAQNAELKSQVERAKQLLEGQQRKTRSDAAKHQSELSEVQERLRQEEASVVALKEDILNKDTHLRKLRTSIKEFGNQNQDLMEKNLSLGEKVKELKKLYSGEAQKLERRLLREMSTCFTELQSLVNVCVQYAEGQEPNLSDLVGVKGIAMDAPEEKIKPEDQVASLKHKLGQVDEMRKDLERLREMMTNKYALDMGEKLTCITQ